jgi:hypothetical protein
MIDPTLLRVVPTKNNVRVSDIYCEEHEEAEKVKLKFNPVKISARWQSPHIYRRKSS